jgi:hypothetical protein
MGFDATRGNKRECHVTSYDVLVQENPLEADELSLSIVNDCGTLTRACDAKKILLAVYKAFLVAEGVTGADLDVYANCPNAYMCPAGGPNMDYYHGSFTLIVTTLPGSAAVPVAPNTITVDLPLECDSVVYS